MSDKDKTKEQLLEEVVKHRRRILTLEKVFDEYGKAKEELYEISERFSKLFHSSNSGIFIHDTEGNIVDINQKALDQFGYSRSDILSLNISDLHPPEEVEASKKAFKDIMRDGHVTFEIDFIKKSGEVFNGEVSSSIYNAGGNDLIQGIVRDITKRKEAERVLNAKIMELKDFYDLAVERERKIQELNLKIAELESELAKFRK